ncbi:MAG: GIY-YIG nuclease family protein [Candidatus Omnitrophica bacterium]|nr:GIY-YIG nuclease family protein [Candidatus Omnitrophota bacterium]MBU4418913.1 GIY-YIG nuclease family protein [Candidatus Omnitrophota bacterium]MBU4467922.1 GIY-YIG nuclease family protein [Candidatus Omnitrophota bacterium]
MVVRPSEVRILPPPQICPNAVRGLEKLSKSIYNGSWHVYIGKCNDNTLYTGTTMDVVERINEHNTTSKCRYTRARKPIVLLYREICKDYGLARKREAQIKSLCRSEKLALIKKSF